MSNTCIDTHPSLFNGPSPSLLFWFLKFGRGLLITPSDWNGKGKYVQVSQASSFHVLSWGGHYRRMTRALMRGSVGSPQWAYSHQAQVRPWGQCLRQWVGAVKVWTRVPLEAMGVRSQRKSKETGVSMIWGGEEGSMILGLSGRSMNAMTSLDM